MVEWFDASDSSTLQRVGYDDESMILMVEFKTSGLYHYFDVPQHIYDGIKSADSRGRYLSQSIKNHYRYSRA